MLLKNTSAHCAPTAPSAKAASTGDNNAMISPAAAVANPHSAWPRVASPTIEAAKYGAYTKVVIRVKNGWTAHSNRIQPAFASREAGLASPACARLANLAASEPQA